MADEFDVYLTDALAPPSRDPDRRFVAWVQARVELESRLDAERRSILRRLGAELIGLAVLAGSLIWVARAEPLTVLASESPWLMVCGLLSIFGLVVLAVSFPPAREA